MLAALPYSLLRLCYLSHTGANHLLCRKPAYQCLCRQPPPQHLLQLPCGCTQLLVATPCCLSPPQPLCTPRGSGAPPGPPRPAPTPPHNRRTAQPCPRAMPQGPLGGAAATPASQRSVPPTPTTPALEMAAASDARVSPEVWLAEQWAQVVCMHLSVGRVLERQASAHRCNKPGAYALCPLQHQNANDKARRHQILVLSWLVSRAMHAALQLAVQLLLPDSALSRLRVLLQAPSACRAASAAPTTPPSGAWGPRAHAPCAMPAASASPRLASMPGTAASDSLANLI